MSTPRNPAPTSGKTITLAVTLFASALAIVSLASFAPIADDEIPAASFDVAPQAVPTTSDTPKEPSSPLLTSVGGRVRTANDPWSADESASGTRPDAMH